MDLAAETDDLEDRWQRMFDEFQNFQAQRRGLRDAARDEFHAEDQEIDGEIARIRSDQAKQLEVIKEEANAEQRQIEEQAAIEIKRVQEEAKRMITDVKKETEREVEILKVDIETQTRELEHKRISRKRKHEEDNRQIESEFLSRLKRLDGQLRASALPATPPPSSTRDFPVSSLQDHIPSDDPSSVAESRPREELPDSLWATRAILPPLRSSEQQPPSRTTLAPDTIVVRGAKKHRFEGFAKNGCMTCKRRARLCDCTRPICGKCKADGRHCIWPQPTAPQQSPRQDTNAANNPHGEPEPARAPEAPLVPRAPSLRPLNTDFRARAHPDLLPAFAYDASRRPSQRLVRLNHSEDQINSPGQRHDIDPESITVSVRPPSVRTAAATQTVSPRGPSVPPAQQPARTPLPSSRILTRKTITYDEVFENVQNKDSREKHYIVEWPRKSNDWYILRCDKHDLNFGEHPFTSARSHLYSEAHGFIERVQDSTVRELGVLVTGCDSKRANRSNAVYKKALTDGYQPKGQARKKKHKAGIGSKPVPKRSRPTHGVLRPVGVSKQFDGIIDPIPGEVYEGAQRQPGRSEQLWYLVVCLPLDDWTTIGIDGTLKGTLLAKSIPACYQRMFLGSSEPIALDWVLGFQINGPRAKDRKFPCLVLRPDLEIPPWDQKFNVPSEERFLAWFSASNLRRRWFRHPWKTLPSSVKGIEDGQEPARRFLRRLEEYRASRGEPRLGVNNRSDRSEAGTNDEDTSDTHDHSIAVAAAAGTTGEHEANGRCPGKNQKDGGAREEREIHHPTEDRILVISSEYDESESSLSPVPSEYDGDEADSSHSSRSSSSDVPDASANPTVVLEDFDSGDYNDPPVSPSATRQNSADSENFFRTNDISEEMSRNVSVATPSAMESLRAIQAELIPGYHRDGSSTVAESITLLERSDQLPLFPGLASRSTQEEGNDSGV